MSALWNALVTAMSWSHQAKLFVENSINVDHDALHLIVGMIIWLGAGLVLRRPLSSWWPWLWLVAVIAWNETADLWTEQWPEPAMQYREGAKDLLVTIIVPTLFMLAARYAPELFVGAERRSGRGGAKPVRHEKK